MNSILFSVKLSTYILTNILIIFAKEYLFVFVLLMLTKILILSIYYL